MIQTVSAGGPDGRLPLAAMLAVADLPSLAPLTRLRVTSWSMFPTLLKGDVIEVAPPDGVRPGDIVVFRRADMLVCHRLTGLGPGEVRTQGDHARAPDPPVPRHELLAKVTAVIRGRRRLSTAPPARAPLASLARMQLDLLWTSARTRVLAGILTAVALVKRVGWMRRALGAALARLVHLSAGVRAPLRSIDAYRFVALGPLSRSPRGFRPATLPRGDVILVASLAGHPLATLEGATGALHVRRAAAGLGLEERLRAWGDAGPSEDAKP